MKKYRVIYLIEWRIKETQWSEMGQDVWEADHNSGIWFTHKGATSALIERSAEMGEVYEMRIAEYIPKRDIGLLCPGCKSDLVWPANYICDACGKYFSRNEGIK